MGGNNDFIGEGSTDFLWRGTCQVSFKVERVVSVKKVMDKGFAQTRTGYKLQ